MKINKITGGEEYLLTAKEYLSQSFCLDKQINEKLQQLDSLNALAEKHTLTNTKMPRRPSGALSGRKDAVTKIIDLEEEIGNDVVRLVDLKADIMEAIKAVKNIEYQTILEKRYLCLQTWEQIALDLGYTARHLYRLYEEALKEVVVPQNSSVKRE